MPPESIPIYLQYGALGLLALFLAWYTKEQQKFIRELMDKLDTNAKEERKDWKEFIHSSTEAQMSTAAAMSQIAQKLESSDTRCQEGITTLRQEHADMQRQYAEVAMR